MNASIIAANLGLESPEQYQSEEELTHLLAEKVEYMMEHEMELLLSWLYRMDISEQKVDQALHPTHPEPANIAIAGLLIDRQKQRIASKLKYKQPNTDNWIWE
jgi:hypothetical protein